MLTQLCAHPDSLVLGHQRFRQRLPDGALMAETLDLVADLLDLLIKLLEGLSGLIHSPGKPMLLKRAGYAAEDDAQLWPRCGNVLVWPNVRSDPPVSHNAELTLWLYCFLDHLHLLPAHF
ncbi:MAG: hypothetical protein J2P28_01110 [Actinobacteria bacterium]|nr:hypothetical protein [Actinomycetota bacterium]